MASVTLRDSRLCIIFSVTLTSVMGVASIAPAFPSISRALDVSAGEIGLLITFFTLPGIFLTPVLGVLADRLNRKVILIPSLFLFGIAGTLCAFSDTFEMLLFFRVLQGMGGAALGVLNLTMIGDFYTEGQRATVMGYNGSVLSIGTAIYPAIGGGLALIGWHVPFFLSLIAIPVGLTAMKLLPESRPVVRTGMNVYLGKVKEALYSRRIIGLLLAMFCTVMILYGGYITFFTVLLDERFNRSSLAIGLILSGSSLVTACTSAMLGRLVRRVSETTLITISALLYMLIFIFIPLVENIWYFALPIFLFGLAQGLNIPSILNLLTGSVSGEYRAAFLSANWIVMRLGQAAGPYLLGVVYVGWNLDGALYTTVVVALLFLCIALTLIYNHSSEATRDK